MTAQPISIRLFQPADAAAFRALNEAWITRYFKLEAPDFTILGDPEGHIIAPGGQILIAECDGGIAGCCALIPHGERCFELGKMAVDPRFQNCGLGGALLRAARDYARQQGARSLYLETNSGLAPALHLYQRHGFRRVDDREAAPAAYVRGDVRMVLNL
ncbi:MAG: GNAT family N-acetyltransferase [Acidobacteriota bacterium]|nr:GNAT family N-acetyltransferase [Acidobacteriota bacterium]